LPQSGVGDGVLAAAGIRHLIGVTPLVCALEKRAAQTLEFALHESKGVVCGPH